MARKAAALLAGGLASLEILEPYAPAVDFEGAGPDLGRRRLRLRAARELARKGMESLSSGANS